MAFRNKDGKYARCALSESICDYKVTIICNMVRL